MINDNSYIINIEKAVLSSILFEHDIIEDILGVLKATDFYLPVHQKVFTVMETLHIENMPIDEEFIRSRVDNREISDEILFEILSANAISNIMAYVEEIKNLSIKRELLQLSTSIKKIILEDDNINALDAINQVQENLYKITSNSSSGELKDMATIIINTQEYIEKMKDRDISYLTGQTSGFYALDKKTTGFNPGDLVIIAARPAMGKTAIILNTALSNLEKGDGVIFFSLEIASIIKNSSLPSMRFS
jgi:replicative DNA helicase